MEDNQTPVWRLSSCALVRQDLPIVETVAEKESHGSQRLFSAGRYRMIAEAEEERRSHSAEKLNRVAIFFTVIVC
jgi:hypothetical protein